MLKKSEEKIAEYIEMLNKKEITICAHDTTHQFSDGKLIGQFFPNNKQKIKKELESNLKYANGYEVAKQKLYSYEKNNGVRADLQTAKEDITTQNNGEIKIRYYENGQQFSDGKIINYIDSHNNEKIKEEFKSNPNYAEGYEHSRQDIENHEKCNGSSIIKKHISEYIEMLNKEKIMICTNDTTHQFSDGKLIGQFFLNNKEKIKEELENNQKYAVGYEFAKEDIADYEKYNGSRIGYRTMKQHISEYIEMINKGEIKVCTKDTIHKFNDGILIGQFLSNNKEKIKEELESNPKYAAGYEETKEKINIYVYKTKPKRTKTKKQEQSQYKVDNINLERILNYLAYLDIDYTKVLIDMQKNKIGINEALGNELFRMNFTNKEDYWLKELYDYIVYYISNETNEEEVKKEAKAKLELKSKEKCLYPKEITQLWNILEYYIEIWQNVKYIIIAFDNNLVKQIAKYNMDEYAIEECILTRLYFNGNSYKGETEQERICYLKELIIDWEYYSDEEKQSLVSTGEITSEEYETVCEYRNLINELISKKNNKKLTLQ